MDVAIKLWGSIPELQVVLIVRFGRSNQIIIANQYIARNIFLKSIEVVWASKTPSKYQLIGRCAARPQYPANH